MKKFARYLPIFALLLLFGSDIAAATQHHGPPVHWVSGTDALVVRQGETFDFGVSFFSELPISNAHLWASGELKNVLGKTGSSWQIGNGDVEPNRIYDFQRSIEVPASLKTGVYSGALQVYHHMEPDDKSLEVYPEILHVTIYVIGATP